MGRVDVDDGVAVQEVAHGRGGCRSPAQRDDGVARQRVRDRRGLHDAEGGLAVGGENIRDRSPLTLDDEGIGVDMGHAEALGQQVSHLGFARARQANKDDGKGDDHARSPTT